MIFTGWSIGEITNQLADFGEEAYIDEFVRIRGPKNYAYRLSGTKNGQEHVYIKVKGLTINNHTAKIEIEKIAKNC